ncbi:hypothetical protein BVG19_g642 [[Candida] boidinii]|nr:hypothetical protein BVG19_g642 [[Candida] boidinii]OWB51906.1 binding protein [[Candida] boidinii]
MSDLQQSHNPQQMEPSRVIYIGSIPFDQTEEQILDIARSVGPVVSSKLLFDKETGKSKGYAFIEYADVETASSAVRNLNNYAIGNRYLKCNFSSEQAITNSGNNNNNNSNSNNNSNNNISTGSMNNGNTNGINGSSMNNNGQVSSYKRYANLKKIEQEIPPLPPGIEIPNPTVESLTATVTHALNQLDPNRLKNLLNDAKIMSNEHPALTSLLFLKNPQLIFSLVQAAMLLGYATPEDVKHLLTNPLPEDEDENENSSEQTENTKDSESKPEDSQTQNKQQENHDQHQGSTTKDAAAYGETSEDVKKEIESLDPEQQQAIKAICEMSEEDIMNNIPIEQRELYIILRNKYKNYI